MNIKYEIVYNMNIKYEIVYNMNIKYKIVNNINKKYEIVYNMNIKYKIVYHINIKYEIVYNKNTIETQKHSKLLSHFSLPTFKSREKTWSLDFSSFIGTHPQLPRQQQPSQRQLHFPLPSVHQHHLLTLLVVKHLEMKNA
jgi:hypothetical protein